MVWWFREISSSIMYLGICVGFGNDGPEVYTLTGLQGVFLRPGSKSLKQYQHGRNEVPPQALEDASFCLQTPSS